MPWVVRDVVREINRAAGKRWQAADPLLPVPGDLPEGCGPPLVALGGNGRPAGLATCRHQDIPDDTLSQTWGTARRFVLTARLRGPDPAPALDSLLGQWRSHLACIPAAAEDDTAALLSWPARDVGGVSTLLRHGFQPMAVIAARPADAGHRAPGEPRDRAHRDGSDLDRASRHADAHRDRAGRVTVREAGPADAQAVTELEMGVIRYDANFGGAVLRPATERLVRAEVGARLGRPPTWTWLAERNGCVIGLIVVQRPQESAWVAGMTSRSPAVYLQTGFVVPGKRGAGVGATLVRHVHAHLDAAGVGITLLHYAQVNPLSGPFWSRMGYRPMWTIWEARPASALR